jgi:hypothetical protein
MYDYGPFQNYFRERVIFIVQGPTTVTVKCRQAIQAMFCFFNMYSVVMLDGVS